MSETSKPNRGNRTAHLSGLREARRKRALTQRELSGASGVAASTIGDLENGKRGAYMTTIKKLKEVFGNDVEDLIEG